MAILGGTWCNCGDLRRDRTTEGHSKKVAIRAGFDTRWHGLLALSGTIFKVGFGEPQLTLNGQNEDAKWSKVRGHLDDDYCVARSQPASGLIQRMTIIAIIMRNK